MPLKSIPGAEAFANLRSNRLSLWPDGRKDRARLNGVAQVSLQPSFALTAGESIFTVGSCFARNIEDRLGDLGFHLPACEVGLPAAERASDTENDFLNKYPPHSILNEFLWALDFFEAAFPERGLLRVKGGLWHDPHSAPNLQPAPLERVAERRELVAKLYRQIPRCRIIIMTLGLVEAWFDEATGYYMNGPPPPAAMQAEPGRFRLDVLTVDEIVDVLCRIHNLLDRYGHPDFRMLLTVSPVPFRNTFTGLDAITANTYSKSALRAAAEMFVQAHARVDYFPSFEIVSNTPRTSAYIQDNRHVTSHVVGEIIDNVVKAYCPELIRGTGGVVFGARRTAAEIQKVIKRGDYARAAELFGSLDQGSRFRRAGFDEFSFHYHYGRVLMRLGSIAEAQAQLARAVGASPDSAEAVHQLGRALARLQRPIDAEEAFKKAVELAPDNFDFRLAYANGLMEREKFEEAEVEILAALELEGDHVRGEKALAAVHERRGRIPVAQHGRG